MKKTKMMLGALTWLVGASAYANETIWQCDYAEDLTITRQINGKLVADILDSGPGDFLEDRIYTVTMKTLPNGKIRFDGNAKDGSPFLLVINPGEGKRDAELWAVVPKNAEMFPGAKDRGHITCEQTETP